MNLCTFELQADGTGKCPRCGAVAARLPAFRECGHPVLPERPPIRGEPIVSVPPGGPGTELMAILKGLGINADESGCKCKQRMAAMNSYGVAWCRQNLAEIVSWLMEEAERRKWPLLGPSGGGRLGKILRRFAHKGTEFAARKLVLTAIERAEAKEKG